MADLNLNTTTTPGYTFSPSAPATITTDSTDTSFIYLHHSPAIAAQLIATARALVHPRGVGIYATDETPEGIAARLDAAFVFGSGRQEEKQKGSGSSAPVCTREEEKDERAQRRRRWHECLYEVLPTDKISGVILHHETLVDLQLAPLLTARGIVPGVRADTDSQPLPISPEEPATQGLDDLLPRLLKAKEYGARFSKWRAPLLCDASTYPTHAALEAQAESLARFAAISQQAGLVPIVEPDVDYSANADLRRSVEVHVRAISMIYARCAAYGVLIEGTLIKPSFPQPGLKHPSRTTTTPEQIAEATAMTLVRSLPVGVAGIVFLSGGLPDETATLYLQRINALVDAARAQSHIPTLHLDSTSKCEFNHTASALASAARAAAYARLPPLSFSFGRALQGTAMKRFVLGDEPGARDAFCTRAAACSLAAKGLENHVA